MAGIARCLHPPAITLDNAMEIAMRIYEYLHHLVTDTPKRDTFPQPFNPNARSSDG